MKTILIAILLFIATATSARPQAVILSPASEEVIEEPTDTNLAGWWEGDASGVNTYNVTFASGIRGSSFDLNGSNAYVELAHNANQCARPDVETDENCKI